MTCTLAFFMSVNRRGTLNREKCPKIETSILGHKRAQKDTFRHIETDAFRGAPDVPRSECLSRLSGILQMRKSIDIWRLEGSVHGDTIPLMGTPLPSVKFSNFQSSKCIIFSRNDYKST